MTPMVAEAADAEASVEAGPKLKRSH